MHTEKAYTGIIEKYLESDTVLGLHQFITMISLDQDEARMMELVKEFCMKSSSPLNDRLALEYFYVNKCNKELTYFIEKNKNSDNSLNQQTAILYELMIDIRERNAVHAIRSVAKNLNYDTPDLQCLHYFLNIELDMSVYYYDKIGYYLNKIQPLLHKIDNPLLVQFFHIRIQLLLFTYYWKKNELILARKHAYEALHMPNHLRQKAELHISLSLSYIYEDFESCIYHLEEAKYIAQLLQDKRILHKIATRTYPFICAHFGKVENVTTNDPVEGAHIEIAKGNKKRAKQLLELAETSTPFTQYYLGLITNKQHHFINSYQEFMRKRSDYFFAKLPMQACEMFGI
ncbi:AimR family lysis-lysogeny pheromone receptor [Gracilibacillus dipsosauri]|uniref:AimR family lysis-lysogeny pheromone receptor n=1 Tax=Gracilibacillus dipsosauri TaxID=178340 RepID=UPI00240930BC